MPKVMWAITIVAVFLLAGALILARLVLIGAAIAAFFFDYEPSRAVLYGSVLLAASGLMTSGNSGGKA